MLAASVDSAAGQSLSADGGVWNHSFNSQHHSFFWVLFHQFVVTDCFHAADPTRVMIVNFLNQFLTGENSFFSIDDDNVVTTVNVWSKNRFMFAAQQVSSFGSGASQRLVCSE